jgi:hypothetical protein
MLGSKEGLGMFKKAQSTLNARTASAFAGKNAERRLVGSLMTWNLHSSARLEVRTPESARKLLSEIF